MNVNVCECKFHYAMEILRKKSNNKEDKEQDEHNEKVNSISKSKLRVRSTKLNDGEFEQPCRKLRKKHCDWIKSNFDTYCPNIKFLKENYMHSETLKNYFMDKSSISYFPSR